jgi:ABC-type antimicrobial peptide transport system permease subunit
VESDVRELDPFLAVAAVAGAITVGLLGALYPALTASQVDPAEALRHV